MPVSLETGSLFPKKARAPRRAKHLAEVKVDGAVLGRITAADQITAAMRSHGITARDIDPILSGRRRSRSFHCNGHVSIVGVVDHAKKMAA